MRAKLKMPVGAIGCYPLRKKKLIFDMGNAIVKSTTTPSEETSIEIQQILNGLRQLIETTKQQVLVYVNQQVSLQ